MRMCFGLELVDYSLLLNHQHFKFHTIVYPTGFLCATRRRRTKDYTDPVMMLAVGMNIAQSIVVGAARAGHIMHVHYGK